MIKKIIFATLILANVALVSNYFDSLSDVVIPKSAIAEEGDAYEDVNVEKHKWTDDLGTSDEGNCGTCHSYRGNCDKTTTCEGTGDKPCTPGIEINICLAKDCQNSICSYDDCPCSYPQ